jgi:hypothetical protein
VDAELQYVPLSAMIPTTARHMEETTFKLPDGNLTRVTPLSVSWATIKPYPPPARAILPQSPGNSSIIQTTIPSGMDPRGRMFPKANSTVGKRKEKRNKNNKKCFERL